MNSPAIVAWMKQQEAKRNPGLDHDKPEEPWPVSPVAPISRTRSTGVQEPRDTGLMHAVAAKDITDERIVEAVIAAREAKRAAFGNPEFPWADRQGVNAQMPEFPPKVVLAKLRSAVKRGLIQGCTCGCRGDFEPR